MVREMAQFRITRRQNVLDDRDDDITLTRLGYPLKFGVWLEQVLATRFMKVE